MKWSTLILVIIAIVSLVGAVLFLIDWEQYKVFPCDDVCYTETEGVVTVWMDCSIPNRKIIHYPNGPSQDHQSYKWHYSDEWGYTTYYDPLDIKSLSKLVDRVSSDYDKGKLTESSYHWFTCVVEAID